MSLPEWAWVGIGIAGQAAFFLRFAVQWLTSEKKQESVIPLSFWYFSLAGGVLLFGYAFYRQDPPFVVLQAINFGIYVRNLVLLRSSRTRGFSWLAIVPLVAIAALLLLAATARGFDWGAATVSWLICGFIGQSLWNCRFVIQWIASERRGKSVMPTAFWWVSLAGDAFLLAYAIYRLDPVFIAGFLINPVIYIRNLVLISRKRRAAAEAVPTGGEEST